MAITKKKRKLLKKQNNHSHAARAAKQATQAQTAIAAIAALPVVQAEEEDAPKCCTGQKVSDAMQDCRARDAKYKPTYSPVEIAIAEALAHEIQKASERCSNVYVGYNDKFIAVKVNYVDKKVAGLERKQGNLNIPAINDIVAKHLIQRVKSNLGYPIYRVYRK